MKKTSIYTHYQPAVTPVIIESSNEKNRNHLTSCEDAFYFVFNGNQVLIKCTDSHYSIPTYKDLSPIHVNNFQNHYLGLLHDTDCYCLSVPTDTIAPEGLFFTEMKPLFEWMGNDFFHLAGKAHQIVTWDQTHQFCGRCGERMTQLEGERAKKCPTCGLVNYPRISPAVITAIFKGDQILLAHAQHFSGNMHSLIAGFVEPGETLEDCVRREIYEEVQLKVKNIQYFGSQPWPFPNSMMVGYIAEYDSGDICVDGVEITHADWYTIHNLPELPSKVSIARDIIEWYISKNS